jgi:mevalonate pyrophosphate decarboxylase
MEAIKDVLNEVNESEQFKKRLTKLIENTMKDAYRDDDIIAVMELMGYEEDQL